MRGTVYTFEILNKHGDRSLTSIEQLNRENRATCNTLSDILEICHCTAFNKTVKDSIKRALFESMNSCFNTV